MKDARKEPGLTAPSRRRAEPPFLACLAFCWVARCFCSLLLQVGVVIWPLLGGGDSEEK